MADLLMMADVLPTDVNAQLRTFLLDFSRSNKGVTSNMESGKSYFACKWLSGKDLHLHSNTIVSSAASRIRATVNEKLLVGTGRHRELNFLSFWAMVSREGLKGAPHRHQGNISGAYYVDAGASGKGGNGGEFIQHDKEGKMLRKLVPRSRSLVLFPSSLIHSVNEYKSEEPRIVLSFNMVFRDKTI